MTGFRKTAIKKILKKKHNNWIETIVDPNTKEVAKNKSFITGGAITSLLMGETPNDYDIYFTDIDATKQIAEYYVKLFNDNQGQLKTKALASCNPRVEVKSRVNIRGESEDRVIIYIKSAGVAGENQEEYRYFEQEDEVNSDIFLESFKDIDMITELAEDIKLKYRPIFFTDNAITLSDKVQLITRFYGSPEEVHKNFDFTHATCYYEPSTDNLVLAEDSLEAILSKSLIYRGSLYPIASIFRVRKFIERGWRITAGQLLKILYQVKDINFENTEVLQDQLMGVDAAYMRQLISRLEAHKGRIDEAYLAKLIDEIFE